MTKIKIAFVHNTAIGYRIPFFKLLSTQYDVDFLFTHEKEFEGLEDVNYAKSNNYFGIAFGLIPRLIKGNYDIVVTGCCSNLPEFIETIFCFIVARLKRKPFILWSEQWRVPRKNVRRFAMPFISFIARHSDAYLVPGTKHKEHGVFLRVLPDKIFIMPNVSNFYIKDTDYIEKEKIKERLNLQNKKIILFVGRLIVLKGIQYLIPAFAKLRKERGDISLLLIGNGEYKEKLQALCKEFNIEKDVYFTGWVKNKNLVSYYLLCNVFVLPSGDTDACPLVVNEAMYCGKPVITTTAVGSAYDMVKDGVNGFIVPEKDSTALCEAMKKIILDPELEKQMDIESKKIIWEGFTYEHMVKGFKEAIEYVTKK